MISISISKQLLSNNLLLSLSIIFLCISSCGSQETSQLRENSIIYCSEGSPDTFNPQVTINPTSIDATSKQFYNTLVSLQSDTSKVAPALAKSWHITKDGLLLTLYLRKNISFHQTSYFTPTRFFNADDVLFSFNRILNNEHPYHAVSGGNYPFFDKIGFKESIESIEKVNDHTVRFKLSQTDSSVLTNLATDFAVILSKEYADALLLAGTPQQIDSHPIGTGPFKLKSYRTGSFIRYLPHENFWGEKSTIKQLVFDITPSNTGRLTKLLAGECDVVNNPIAHGNIKNRKDLSLDTVTSFNVSFLSLNTQKPPLSHVTVRQAIRSAINKQKIVDTLFANKAEVAHTIIPPNSWAFPENIAVAPYSKITALEQLIVAGYGNEFNLKLLVKDSYNSYNPDSVTMAEMISKDLLALGITVDISVEYSNKHTESNLNDDDYDMVLHGWVSEHSDPNNFFMPLLACNAIEESTNSSQWCNVDYEHEITSALKTNKLAQRKYHYEQAINIINAQVPLIPISHSKQYLARSNKITGQIITAFGGINFLSVKKN